MSTSNAMIGKDLIGAGVYKKNKRLKTRIEPVKKVPVWVPDLKMTIMMEPDADVAAIVQRYKDHKEWERKSLH